MKIIDVFAMSNPLGGKISQRYQTPGYQIEEKRRKNSGTS